MSFSVEDSQYMSQALQLAKQGQFTTQPNPRVGCVLVKDGQIVGRGYHARAGGPHAEVVAIKQAGYRAYGATAYVTLEPCAHTGRTPPCAQELVVAGVKRVVAATKDSNPLVAGKGLAILEKAGIKTEVGLLEAEAQALNRGFLRRMQGGLPWVRVKMAMSLDGRTAMSSGESRWITGADARLDVQKWRAMSSAIISGIGCILADNPELSVRTHEWKCWTYGDVVMPWRIVLDSQLRCPLNAKWLQVEGRKIIVCTQIDSAKEKNFKALGVEVWSIPNAEGQVDLHALLQRLAQEGANELFVEAGPHLAGAFMQAHLVDEMIVYMAPTLLGSSALPLLNWPMQKMREQVKLDIKDMRMVGHDLRLITTFHKG